MSLPPILSTSPTPQDGAFWIQAATDAIRAYCGWHVAPSVTEQLTVDGSGTHALQIKSKHVTAVTAVTVDGVVIEADWSEAGVLTRRDGCNWPKRFRSVTVDLTHGYDTNGDLQAIIAGIAQRSAMNPTGIVVNQRAGTQGVGFATAGGAVGSAPLMQHEKDALAPYRLNWGP